MAPLLAAADPALRETATWIAGRHAEWGAALAGPLRERLATAGLPPDQRGAGALLAQLATAAPIQELLAEEPARSQGAAGHPVETVLRAMAQSGVKPTPKAWLTSLTAVLKESGRLVTSVGRTPLRHLAVAS